MKSKIVYTERIECPVVEDDYTVGLKTYSIEWMSPVLLSTVNDLDYLKQPGVYFLYWDPTNKTNFDYLKWPAYLEMLKSEHIFYIGKSGREYLKVRANKHRRGLLGDTNKGIRPGKNMLQLSEEMNHNIKNVYFFCGVVEDSVVAHMLEPIFGKKYKRDHGRLPRGNTQKF